MTNKEFAAGLRELADLYEADENMIRPNDDKLSIYPTYSERPERLRAFVAALVRGGKIDKIPPKSKDEWYYRLRRQLPSGLTVEFNIDRSTVCKKVRRMEMVETWECPDSLLDEPESIEASA